MRIDRDGSTNHVIIESIIVSCGGCRVEIGEESETILVLVDKVSVIKYPYLYLRLFLYFTVVVYILGFCSISDLRTVS